MSGRISVYGFPFVGKLVFFPVLIAVRSFLFVPVQPLHRDMEALKDDWNDFNDLDYSANKFGASNPRVRSNIRSVSCSSPLHRDMEALKDDWNDFNDLGHSANKSGASNPRVRSNIRSVSCSSPLHRDMEALKDDWNDFNDLDYSANKFGASNPRVRSNIRSLSCSSPLHRDMDAFNADPLQPIFKLIYHPLQPISKLISRPERRRTLYYQQASPELDALALQASFAQAQLRIPIQPGAARTGAPYQNSPIQCFPVAPRPYPYPSTAASSSHNHATHPGSSQIESQAKAHVPFIMEVPPKLGKYKPRGRAMNACGSDIPPGPAYYPQAPVQIESSWDVLVPGVAGPTSLGTPSKPKRNWKKKCLTKLHEEGAASSSLTAPVEEAEASAERSQAVAPLEPVNEASSAAETFDAIHDGNDEEQLSPIGTTSAYSTYDSGSSAEQSPQYPATPSDEFGEMLAAGSKSEADTYFDAFVTNIESGTYDSSALDAAFVGGIPAWNGVEWWVPA
ncbi:hypothetical protein C8R46DRAFT_1214109 [Mycena filopes]|nr:hypothetical protein C8R46DRAFT_1214109 [Mycena filopes]